jgi:putative ABC transport system substrate-binding protein
MRRREFISILGGAAAAWPLRAHTQQTMPLVGFLNGASPDSYRFNADSFREGFSRCGKAPKLDLNPCCLLKNRCFSNYLP